jgi:LacI family sucrose operon transcriptional repressor
MKIKDIADMAGVSPAMVSRTINNSGYVSAANKEKILKIIEETGFQLNQQARGLRTKKSGLIACLIPGMDSLFVMKIAEQLIHLFEQKGYHLLIITWRHPEKPVELIEILRNTVSIGVDGIILFHDNIDERSKAYLQNLDLSVICVDQEVENVTSLINAQFEAGYDLARLAIDKGYHHFAYLISDTLKEGWGMKKAFDECQDSQVKAVSYVFDLAESHFDQVPDLAKMISEQDPQPEIFLAFSDQVALGVKSWFAAQQKEIAVAGIGNTKAAYMTYPAMTSVSLHTAGLCDHIVDTMIAQLNDDTIPAQTWRNTCSIENAQNL